MVKKLGHNYQVMAGKKEILKINRGMTTVIQGDDMLFREFLDKVQLIDPKKGRIPLEKTPVVDMFTKAFDETNRGLFLTSRQVGASTMLDCYALYQALILGKTVLVLATKRKSASYSRELMNINQHLLMHNNEITINNSYNIRFSNGGRIIFGNINGNSARGIQYDICLIHDYAFASEKDQQECWDTAVNTHGVEKVYIYSCAHFAIGKFYELWEDTMEGCKSVSNWKYYKFTYQDALEHSWNDYTVKKNYLKNKYGKESFSMEYECKFQSAPEKSSEVVNLRVTTTEKDELQNKADALNFRSISEYLRFVGLNSTITISNEVSN